MTVVVCKLSEPRVHQPKKKGPFAIDPILKNEKETCINIFSY
jgi:hypothetical protein